MRMLENPQKHRNLVLIYTRFARHPSYLGFFYFGIGTQVMLANPVSSAVFAAILWRFFSERIR